VSDTRARILGNLRSGSVPIAALPDLDDEWVRYPDRVAKFSESVELVGGQVQVLGVRSAASAVADLLVVKNAHRICSLIPGVPGNVDLAQIEDPHALADLDVTIVRGEFGVAENGAIWINDRDIRHRAALFVTLHLVMAVDANTLVNNLHEGYAQVGLSGRGFGVFISGPSKTADIEQSLVIGAHGPRSATILITGPRA
jgi:L-lactate dehydrogenase complex protein LldG